MGGKKGDAKPAKKGGGKESSAPAKSEAKGKDDKKGGKDKGKEDKKKGRDARKGKKQISEEEEEVSEPEVAKEQSEESKNEEEEEEDIQPARARRGRDKGVAALKGASKAMAGMNKGMAKGAVGAAMDLKAKEQKKDLTRAQLKGATKAMAGLAKKPPPPAKKKRSLKATSKMFMKFSKLKPKRSKKGHFKVASKLFMGFRKKFAASSMLDKKKKSAAMLKNTSKLMLGLKRSSKKQLPKPPDSSKPRPSFLLIRLGGNAPKPEQEKKVPNKLFGGLFNRKKAKLKFKPRAKVLTKVSAAASWLTKRFLSKKNKYFQNERAIQDAWLTRMGAQKLPFPSEEELQKYRMNIKRFPGGHRFYGQNEDVYGHPKDFEAYRHQRFPTQRYVQGGQGTRYDDPSVGYYDYQDEEGGFDNYGYPNEEYDYPYDQNGQDFPYGGTEEDYDNYSGYPMEEDYTSYHENMEYCDEESHLLKSQNNYFDYEVEVHHPQNAYSSYGYEESEIDYSGDALNPYDQSENEDDSYGYFTGQDPYSEMEETDHYNAYGTMGPGTYSRSPYAEPVNPYAHPLDDIMENEDLGDMAEHSDQFDGQHIEEDSAIFSRNRKYKLFPRPQVKLFGRERLDVSLPPSPHISFTDFDEEEEGEDEPLLGSQQWETRQPVTKSLFTKSAQRSFGQQHARGVQKLLSTKPIGRKWNPPQDHYQDSGSQDYSPRAFGSPLGQFMKRTLSPKPILKRNDSQSQRYPVSPPPRSQFSETSFARAPSPQLPVKHVRIPSPNDGHHNAGKPNARQLEALQKDLENERHSPLPYHKRFGHKLTGMETSNVPRKTGLVTSNNNSNNTNSSLQQSESKFPPSPHMHPRFNKQPQDVTMPPSPNLSTRQRPVSPKPSMNAFGLNKSNIYGQNQPAPLQPGSSFRQRDHSPSPQMNKNNFQRPPSPTRTTHWASNSTIPTTSPVGTFSNTSAASPSSPSSLRRGNSFRNDHGQLLSTQPSIKPRVGSNTLQVQGMRSREDIQTHSSTTSPRSSPLLQRFGSIRNKEFQSPPSPQPMQMSAHSSKFNTENQVADQRSPVVGRRQINNTQNWGNNEETTKGAPKSSVMNPFMKHLRRTGEMKPLNSHSPRGSMADRSPYRDDNINPPQQMSQRKGNMYGAVGAQSEQPKSPSLGRHDGHLSNLYPPRQVPSPLPRQGSENSMTRQSYDRTSQSLPFSDTPRSPLMGRHNSIKGSLNHPPQFPASPVLKRQGNRHMMPSDFSEVSSQSVPISDQAKLPMMARHNSMKGTLNRAPRPPISQLVNQQGGSRFTPSEFNEPPTQAPPFSDPPRSPLMGRHNSIKGTLNRLPQHPVSQTLNMHRSSSFKNRDANRDALQSPLLGQYNGLRESSEMPAPASSVPEPKNPFWKRVGQPLVGMSQGPPPSQQLLGRQERPMATHLPEKAASNTFVKKFGQMAGSTHRPKSPSLSSSSQNITRSQDNWQSSPNQTLQRNPMPYAGNMSHPRSPSQPAPKSLGGFMAESLNQASHESSKTGSTFHLEFRGSPTLAGANNSHPRYPPRRDPFMGYGPPKQSPMSHGPPKHPSMGYGPPIQPAMSYGPPRQPADFYEGDYEDPVGRYAVVMPQVHRMEAFRGRGSPRGSLRGSLRGSVRKPPWPRQHVGNFQEMHGMRAPNKAMYPPWTETLRRGSRRAKEKVASYLAHGSMRSQGGWQQMTGKGHGPQFDDKMQPMRSSQYTEPGQEQDGNMVQDLTQLEDLQELSVLNNLRKRFERDLIYTYIGSILISLNPYKMLNIYGTDHVLHYEGRALGENPPHLFAIANVAYTKLMDAKHNQCIIISGESGSGKTEATKLVLRYLVAVNQRRGVTNQILEATPLLESFGNAKTVRNDNSSRFGKFVEIYMEEGIICGAITSQYLLEKSRIVFQAKNERNYHIFYEMLAGLPAQQKQLFYLQDAETYYYLNQGGNCEIPSKSDAEDFRRLLNAMESLSFNGEDQDSIFRVLSSILHLGNVYFEKYETESQEVASVVSASEIRVVSELLQISPEGLQKSITYKVTETLREKIYTPLSVDSAVDARDAIAKILYSLLFSWLTDRINKLVYPRQDALSIAILDIYGFEDLNFNSFEQLCINYANEYLQFFFNKIVFREEQEEYIREQIDWREISFNDNQACIDIISQKPYGILRILDDQSCFPQATDHTFLQKCHYHHGTSELYCKPKMPLPEFGIKHFAGKVTYQVHKFLDKNYDQVKQDVLDLFVNSKIKVVGNLFFSHAQVLAQQKTMMGKSSTTTRKFKAQTVAAKFQQSLLELVEKMERCNPFFVRCIKPNSKKEPEMFEADIVVSQLKYSGILETIRIRKEGFPVRIPFHFFLSRYRCVMDLGRNIHADGQICVTLLRKLCPSVSPNMYCIGVSKLFMKENLYQQLESKRDQLMNKAAVTLQRYSRGYLTRKRYTTLRYRIINLQALARGYLARRRFQNYRKSLQRLRAVVRMYVNRRRYLRMKAEIRRQAEEERRKAEQELTKREVFNVTHLELPAELAGLLRTAPAQINVLVQCVVSTYQPRVQVGTQLNLPLDINNYPMFKYVRVFFREPLFGMLTMTLGSSLLPVEDDLKPQAITAFKLILRFMGDPFLNEIQEIVFGNYVIQKCLSNVGLRDEILAQIANQVWRNTNPNNEERGWYLLACCLSSFAPSPNLDKYLLKYVSDFAYNGYKPVCQHKLILAIQKSQQGSETARTFPPCLLEWTASRERANMALDIYCFDGTSILCPIHSWTDGEELAGDVLRHRGVMEGWRGWSVSIKDGGQWSELAGHDYVLDLISNVELPREFPKQKSYFITSEGVRESTEQRSVVFGNGPNVDEEVPPPPMMKAPSLPPQGVHDSEGYYSHDSDTLSEPPSQKGMDHYLDSLFDPVLSYGNGDLEKLTAMSQKMKGGGGVGGRDGAEVPGESSMQAEGSHHTGMDPSLYAQQQAYINQQAMILAQQMTLQAMAIQQQMVNNSTAEPPVATGPKPSISSPSSRGSSYRVTPTVAPMPRTGVPTQKNVVNGSPPYRTHTSPSREGSFRQMPGPSNRPRPEELIHHTTLNSEHFPEPTHNIKDIINQYKQPEAVRPVPQPVRKEPTRPLGRKLDPHEEAMKILKGQMASRPMKGPSPVSNMSYVPKPPRESVAMVKPVPSIKNKKPASLPPVSHVRPTTAPPVSVSRELSEDQENIQTQLHRQYSEEYYTYSNVPWRIYIRKEVFYPRDSFNNPLILDLVFKQVVNDTLSESCVRITKEERQKMRSLLAEYRLDSINAITDDSVKKKVVTAAREEWEVYFSRLFPAAGSVGTGVQILGVSHNGIKLLKMLKSGGNTPEQLRVLRSYSYTDIMFVTVLSKNMLEFNLTNEKLILFSSRSSQVKSMIDSFLMELKKDSNYVVAVQNYVTEDKSFLSFHKGDIIRLQPLDGLQKGQNYGCVVRKKVVYLEELKRGIQDFGWKFGALHGRSALFPGECVQPVAAPDFVNLPADRKGEPQNRQSRAAASAAVAVAVASTAVAHEFDRKTDGSPTPSEYAESLDEYTDPSTSEIVLQGSPYNMVEFAKKYFREGQRLMALEEQEKRAPGDSSKPGSKKSRESRDPAELLKFTKNPIQESLIEFSDSSMNRIASELFLAVMRFMGDAPLKGQSELDVVTAVLRICGEHEVLKDESYCQIIKQITDNSSTKTDSCQRGWRLLYILSAYHRCSEVLKPYLFKYLQDTCRSPGLHFQGIAKACEQNLRKTLLYGGRCEFPSTMELKAMVAGRSSKRQLFLLPGGIERHLKIKTCSVAFDVIEEICTEMGVHRDEAYHEYAIFAVTNRGQNVRPLNRKEYILDVSAEMEQTDSNYMFWFRRIIWAQPLKFENELYVTMHYNQVLPDYLKGLFNVFTHSKPTEQQFQQISRLAALQHRAKDSVYLPTAREVQDYIPNQFYKSVKPQSWLNMVMQHMQQIQPLSPHQGRAQFLGLVSAFPMFGSAFFYIQSCSNNMVISPCILAINQNGLNFLNKETHELMVTFPLKDIQSTRTQRPAPGFSYPYVDILLGDMTSQRITQLQLEQGLELCRVVAVHVENLLQSRDKRLTLPPSEITLL
ncbi:unconventional myosin-XV [Rana temporaria]|uniref:unconventional myosin-XV n=1 Tax=Rana temporaria TaxID=8407 RepID=UPI001AAC7AE9|nr:unconventional myosin-XV [Rana temporaria]